ncbi:MAG: hypothetical protein LRZ91_04225 [Desulfotomaculum sp.]|nr:hypothetical protein [Desulfotomaculum sp.]
MLVLHDEQLEEDSVPATYGEEINFLRSDLPHSGHFISPCPDLPTPHKISNFLPHDKHLYSKIGIF